MQLLDSAESVTTQCLWSVTVRGVIVNIGDVTMLLSAVPLSAVFL